MACGDGCCGGDEPVLLPPIKVPRPAKDAETEDSRCCADNDADADADACCDGLSSIVLSRGSADTGF